MARAAWALVVLCACGRVNFDAPGGESGSDAGGSASGDATAVDGAGSGSAVADAAVAGTCGAPVDLVLGSRVLVNTCAGFDALDGCGPQGTQEVIVRFTAPAAAGYTFRAFDKGTNNVSDSIERLDDDCTVGSFTCSGVLGLGGVAANEVLRFIIESSSGGCDDVEVQVD